jgi:RNA polymerase sigma-70 factor (ECF subfamily)
VSTVQNADFFIETRWSLLSRLRNLDDQASWQDFFDTYWRLIYGVARRAGLEDSSAQEVVQETVLTVIRNLAQFKTDPEAGSFKGWLLRIVSWRVADQFRAKQRNEARMVASQKEDSTATGVLERVADPTVPELERIWDEEWEKHLLEATLERVRQCVSPKQFQMFDLYVLKQWPVREVARALHTTVGHVYVAKHRVAGVMKRTLRELENACG